MSEACSRWIALSDREAIDDVLGDDERAFLHSHAAECADCGREGALWQSFAELVEPTTSTVAQGAPAPVAPLRRRRAIFGALVATAAAVALAAVGVRFAAHGGVATRRTATLPAQAVAVRPPLPEPRVHVAVAPLGETRGELEVDGQLARVGDPVRVGALVVARRGPACLTVEPGVRACLVEGSRVRVTELSREARRLTLLVGKLAAALDPQPVGSSFGIVTREGTAIAVGTAYSVEVPDRGAIVTRVMHGTVLVHSGGRARRVTAHQMTAMDGELLDLPLADEARELALVASDASARALNDAPAPMSPQRPPEEAPSRVDRSKRAVWPASHPTTRRTLPSATPPAEDSAPLLLLAAREARARGDAQAALRVYRELFERYEHSGEAHTARIPFGEMLLSDGHARAALAAFERYLAQGGPLAEEASFGRVRALRALGATSEERAALVDFLRSHPDSPLSAALRARAQTLGVP